MRTLKNRIYVLTFTIISNYVDLHSSNPFVTAAVATATVTTGGAISTVAGQGPSLTLMSDPKQSPAASYGDGGPATLAGLFLPTMMVCIRCRLVHTYIITPSLPYINHVVAPFIIFSRLPVR